MTTPPKGHHFTILFVSIASGIIMGATQYRRMQEEREVLGRASFVPAALGLLLLWMQHSGWKPGGKFARTRFATVIHSVTALANFIRGAQQTLTGIFRLMRAYQEAAAALRPPKAG